MSVTLTKNSTDGHQSTISQHTAPEKVPAVLVVAKAFPPVLGGVETYSERLAIAYAETGAPVTVVTHFPGATGWSELREGNVRIRILNVGPGSQPRIAFRMLRAINRLAKTENFDIVHATTWRVLIPVYAAVKLGRKFAYKVVTIHGREILQTPPRLMPLLRGMLSFVDRVIAISPYTRAASMHVLPDGGSNCEVAFNGATWANIPARTDYAIPQSRPLRLLSACRLAPRKNIASLIEAVKILRDDMQIPVTLDVCGSGPERDALVAAADHLGVSSIVAFRGKVESHVLHELYSSTDIFVHPHSHARDATDVEGFCLSVADAMAFGDLVVSGRDGATADYIKDGFNGFLVPGESSSAVASAIAAIARMGEQKRSELGREAAKTAAQFSWQNPVSCAIAGWQARLQMEGKHGSFS